MPDRLTLPDSSPRLVLASGILYIAHILCEGWIASSESFLALSILTAIVALVRREMKISVHLLFFPLFLFLAASSISALVSARPWSAFFEIGEWFTLLSFPLGLSLYRAVPGLTRRAATAFAVLGTFMAAYGFFQYFILGYWRLGLEQRITGPAAHVMTYSGILMPVTLIMMVLWIEQRRFLFLIPALLGSLALVLTFTRGVWIGWVAGFAVLLVLRKPAWMLFAVPLLVLAIALSPLTVFGRLVSMFDVRQSSNFDRIRMAQGGFEIIRDEPLWGVGPSNIKENYALYRAPDAPRFRIPHLHNNVIQLWAERGILALSAYLLLMILFLRECVRVPRADTQRRAFADAGIAIAVSLAVAGLFEFNFGDTEVLLTMLDLFALIIGAITLPAFVASAGSSPVAPATTGGRPEQVGSVGFQAEWISARSRLRPPQVAGTTGSPESA
ncbi:MAG TPA: O-antigen ligase family protein [Thermoanaerobaculia bacterium]|nr:O-antigen ligase family protein [Thermoanaerobaculia bacterium]